MLRSPTRACAAVVAAAVACAPIVVNVPVTVTPPAPVIDAEHPQLDWGLVIHGGAGSTAPENTSPVRRAALEAAMTRALQAGYAILARGGHSLDAVEAAVIVLEDDSNFNAGKGSVFTADGRNELDAAIMDGSTLRAGAVAGLRRVKNPIRLARAVMEQSEHVFMVGEGAEQFARDRRIQLVDPSYFRTERAWRALERERAAERQRGRAPRDEGGTVGAIARDRAGRLAAATSTGGRTNKRYGRVGDVPVIGAGTYARGDCAVSATGHGEWFIRYTVARDVCAALNFPGQTLRSAADSIVMRELRQLDADGGIIAIDAAGHVAMPFNTEGMPRAYVGPDGVPHVLIFR
jgi:L-asparaginase / beta-aspartyl-peptidase